MDDLISRAQMSEAIRDYFKDLFTKGIHELEITEFYVDVQNIIEVQPTVYNVDKVVEQIKTHNYSDGIGWLALTEVTTIVKAGGVNG